MHNFEGPSVLKNFINDEQIIFSIEGKETKAYQNYRKSTLIFGTIWIGGIFLMFIEALLKGHVLVILVFLIFVIIGIAWAIHVQGKMSDLADGKVVYVGTAKSIIKYKNEVITSYKWEQFANMTHVLFSDSPAKGPAKNKLSISGELFCLQARRENRAWPLLSKDLSNDGWWQKSRIKWVSYSSLAPKQGDLKLYLKTKPKGGDYRYKREVTNGACYVLKPFHIEGIEDVFGIEQKCFQYISKYSAIKEDDLSNNTALLDELHRVFSEKVIDFIAKNKILFMTKSGKKKNKKNAMILGIVMLVFPTLFSLTILFNLSAFTSVSITVQLLTMAMLGIFFWWGIMMLPFNLNKTEKKEYYIGSAQKFMHLKHNSLKTIGWNEFESAPKLVLSAKGHGDLVYHLKGGYKRKTSFIQEKVAIIACPDAEHIKKESINLINEYAE